MNHQQEYTHNDSVTTINQEINKTIQQKLHYVYTFLATCQKLLATMETPQFLQNEKASSYSAQFRENSNVTYL